MQMNLPNKLTILRVLMIPFFVVFMLWDITGAADKWIAAVIFIVASLTDMLDGKIARKYNLVTNFGKFMDPLADKLLVSAAMICLVEMGRLPAWIVIIIISREFIISGFRLIAAERGIVIAAGWMGKWKTAVTMVMLAMMLLGVNTLGFPMDPTQTMGVYGTYMLITDILRWISVILTVVSRVDYLVKNKDVMKDEV